MAFCKYCGSKIEDGQICTCEAAQAAAQAEGKAEKSVEKTAEKSAVTKETAKEAPEAEASEESVEETAAKTITIAVPNVDKDLVVGALGRILNVLKAPAVGGAEFMSGNNRNLALILVAIQAFFSSVLTCFYVGKINSALKAASNAFIDMSKFKFSGIQGFFVTLILSIFFSALFAAVFFVAAKILKWEFSVNQAIELAGIRSIYTTIATALAIVFAVVDIRFSLVVFFAAALFVMAIIQGVLAAKYADKPNAVVYTTMACAFLFVGIMVLIMTKGYSLYLPKAIKENLGSASNLLKLF